MENKVDVVHEGINQKQTLVRQMTGCEIINQNDSLYSSR